MPELPEVEIIRQELSPQLENSIVLDSYTKEITLRSKLLPSLKGLTGQRLQQVKRRNKYLIFVFEKNTVLVHLGMTGQLILQSTISKDKHCHWWIKIGDFYLNYIDRFTESRKIWTLVQARASTQKTRLFKKAQ